MSSLEDELRIIEALGRAIQSGNGDQLREEAYNLDTQLINVGSFSPTLFKELIKLLTLHAFLTLEGSFPLLKIFQDSFDYLTEDQKDELLRVLEACYQDLTDPTSCFLVSEIVGESYCDERALETLRRLKATKADVPRSLVPHGLEYFARKCGERELARLAFNELLQMRSDPSENVRDEAITSLNQLTRHGWPPSNESRETKSLDP
jgi:hypothetical protein